MLKSWVYNGRLWYNLLAIIHLTYQYLYSLQTYAYPFIQYWHPGLFVIFKNGYDAGLVRFTNKSKCWKKFGHKNCKNCKNKMSIYKPDMLPVPQPIRWYGWKCHPICSLLNTTTLIGLVNMAYISGPEKKIGKPSKNVKSWVNNWRPW